MKPLCVADPVHLTCNSGIVRDVVYEIVTVNIFSIVFAKLRVTDRHATFLFFFMFLSQYLEYHIGLLQFVVNILIVNGCVHSFFSDFLWREEWSIYLIRRLTYDICKAYTKFISFSPNCYKLR